jgi:uncharacterized membrane protein YeaQ/YmgE (transglycosylase-associated protein family)
MVLFVFAALIILFVVLPLLGAALWWVIATAVTGLILGALGRLIVPGQQPIGVLATIVCGWFGSLVGGIIGGGIWGFNHHHHWFATLLIEVAVSAAAVLVWSRHDRRMIHANTPHRVIDV